MNGATTYDVMLFINWNVYCNDKHRKRPIVVFILSKQKLLHIERNHKGQILQNFKLQSHFDANSETGDMSQSLLSQFLGCDVKNNIHPLFSLSCK